MAHVNEPTLLLTKSRENSGKVVRQYKPAAIIGWWGLQVTVIKLHVTFRHLCRPGDCQITNNNYNNNQAHL